MFLRRKQRPSGSCWQQRTADTIAGTLFDGSGRSVVVVLRPAFYLQTSVRHIYAVGDCIGGAQFTHLAGWQAFTAVLNMMLFVKRRGTLAYITWATFTDPEIAQIGLTEKQARERYGDAVRVTRRAMDRTDRAITDDAVEGFVKAIYRRRKLVGATIVAPRAGEMIAEYALALESSFSPNVPCVLIPPTRRPSS